MFEVNSFTYDGSPHSLTLEMNLPNNIEVRYENNTRTKVGSYLKNYMEEVYQQH